MDEIVFEPSDVNMLAALGIVESVKLFPFMLSKMCIRDSDTPFFRTARCEYEQGLGQVRPNKITSKLARVADVKSCLLYTSRCV